MKQFNKQILEAIKRGVNIALDDYEEQDGFVSPQKDVITYKNTIKFKLRFDELVDKYLHNSMNITTEEFQEIADLSKKFDFKYLVDDYNELDFIIRMAAYLDGTHEIDLNWLDISRINNLHNLFSRSTFNRDISKWDVSHVTNMQGMFSSTTCFQGDLSKWDVRNVKNMQGMFAYSLYVGDLSSWQISDDCDTEGIFDYCPIENHHKPKKLRREYSVI